MAIRKAQRRKAKLRLGISGPAGSGKTFGSLLTAYGITQDWEKICLIDTENGSGDLYANYNQNGFEIGEYNIIELTSPYSPEKYVHAIRECEAAGIDVIIIDSLTHAWSGEGGLLDKKGKIEASGKAGVNSWTAWRDVTPMHNRLVESILTSKSHIITTLRAKMDYVQEKDSNGKYVIRKIGMNPIQRDGMEYEFTVFVDVSQEHQATSSKDRTSLFDGKIFSLGVDTGRQLLSWLEKGIDAPAVQSTSPTIQNSEPQAEVRQQAAPQQTQASAKDNLTPITKSQITHIENLAKKANITDEHLAVLINEQFQVNSISALSSIQANSFIRYIQEAK